MSEGEQEIVTNNDETVEYMRGFVPVEHSRDHHGDSIAEILAGFSELEGDLGELDEAAFEALMERIKAAFAERSGADINSGVVHETYDRIEASWKAKHPEASAA